MEIIFISDYVCPYCIVAKEALKAAIHETGIKPNITWQPMELTEEPNPQVDTYHDANRRLHYHMLDKPCEELNLNIKIPPKVIPRPYSRLAFEGWYYALEKGLGEIYNDAIYNAYFMEERDIGDIEVLSDIAQNVGLDASDFRRALLDGVYSSVEKAAVCKSKNDYHADTVPTIFVDGKKMVLQTYTKEEFVQILTKENEPVNGNRGFSCGADGCH